MYSKDLDIGKDGRPEFKWGIDMILLQSVHHYPTIVVVIGAICLVITMIIFFSTITNTNSLVS